MYTVFGQRGRLGVVNSLYRFCSAPHRCIASYILCSYHSDNVIHKKVTQITVNGSGVLIDTGNDIVGTYTRASRHCRIDWDHIFHGYAG